MREIKTYRIETSFACGAVTTEGKKIIKEGTAPVFKKFIGKSITRLRAWLLNKTGEVLVERI